MTSRSLLIRVVAATLFLLVWGMVFWGLLQDRFPVYRSYGPERELDAVARALVDSSLESGSYFYPWPRDTPQAAEAWLAAHRAGPFFELNFSRTGVDPQSPGKLLAGTVQYAVVSALAALLVSLSGARRGRAFAVVLTAGAMATIFIQLTRPLWFHLPWHYSLAHATFEMVAWLLLASAMSLRDP